MRVPLPAAFLSAPLTHRGYHNRAARRPENSPGAVQAAIAAGYGIEIDLQLSHDGVAMVFHDERLDRLTEATGLVKDRTAAELGQIKLRHSDDAVPTLTAILAQINGRAPLLIELKDQTGSMSQTDGRLEAATAAALADYVGDVAVMSFNPHAVALLARLAPHIPRGLTTSSYDPADWAQLLPATCDRLRAIPDYDCTFSSFISHEVADLPRPRVAELKAAGAIILCWTVSNLAVEVKAREVAQNITFESYPAAIRP